MQYLCSILGSKTSILKCQLLKGYGDLCTNEQTLHVFCKTKHRKGMGSMHDRGKTLVPFFSSPRLFWDVIKWCSLMWEEGSLRFVFVLYKEKKKFSNEIFKNFPHTTFFIEQECTPNCQCLYWSCHHLGIAPPHSMHCVHICPNIWPWRQGTQAQASEIPFWSVPMFWLQFGSCKFFIQCDNNQTHPPPPS